MLPLILSTALAASPADPYVQVDGGYLHTCARAASGAVKCWGGDDHGEVGGAPQGVFTQVSAGQHRSCALPADGPPLCWGQKLDVELDPDLLLDIDDEGIEMPDALSVIAVGGGADCGLDPAGQVQCWGRPDPLLRGVPTETELVALSVGFNHGCAQRKDGSLVCWGSGSGKDHDPPFQAVPPPWPVTQVAVGLGYHTCGLRSDGSVGCWGGDGSGDGGNVYAGHLRAPPGSFVAITAGHDHSCGLTAEGKVTCWGALGDPPEEDWTFSQISSGAFHVCGVTTDGRLRCWGNNQFSQVSATPGAD